MKKLLAIWFVCVLFNLALWVTIICVAIHFITKYW
jgi:hypothetical protein